MENKIKYKLFFCDLDHTLLVDNHIPEFNLKAIKKAKEKGIKFIICTGRPYNLMNYLLKELNTENSENEYTICNSGSTIYENKNRKLIYFKGIDEDIINILFEYGKKFKDIVIIFDSFDIPYFYNEEKVDKEQLKGFKYKIIKSLDEIKNIKVIRLLFFSKNSDYLLNIKNEIGNIKNLEGKITYFMSGKNIIEINSFGVCKGEALRWLSNYLNVDLKETIAIGDDYNDESMLKMVGLGCCVKSAHEDIKKVSKYFCQKDYFEGSVKEVIDKFILN